MWIEHVEVHFNLIGFNITFNSFSILDLKFGMILFHQDIKMY